MGVYTCLYCMCFSSLPQVSILDESGPENLFRFPYSETAVICYNNIVVMETERTAWGEMNMRHTRWFKDMVFYQIWPRSIPRLETATGSANPRGVSGEARLSEGVLASTGVWFSAARSVARRGTAAMIFRITWTLHRNTAAWEAFSGRSGGPSPARDEACHGPGRQSHERRA